MRPLQAALLAALVLTGCATPDPRVASIVDITALPKEEREAGEAIRLWHPVQLIGKQFKVVGLVRGYSCQANLSPRQPTQEEALAQLRLAAAKLGANGVTSYQCEQDSSIECVRMQACKADAIVL